MAARARGKAHVTQSVSGALAIDPPLEDAQFLSYFVNPSTTPKEIRITALGDRDQCQQFVVPFGDNFVLFIALQVVKDAASDRLLAVGSISDTLGQVTPVSVPVDQVFLNGFISLTTRRTATALGLSVADSDPGTVAPPAPDLEDEEAEDAQDQPQASLGRLNFGDVLTPEDHPTMAFFPSALPLPPGRLFTHNAPITSHVDSLTTWELGQAWAKAIQYLVAQNNGRSVLFSDQPMFDGTVVVHPAWWDADSRINDSAAFKGAQGAMLLPADSLYHKVETKMSLLVDCLWVFSHNDLFGLFSYSKTSLIPQPYRPRRDFYHVRC